MMKAPFSIARARTRTCQCACPVWRVKAAGRLNTSAPATASCRNRSGEPQIVADCETQPGKRQIDHLAGVACLIGSAFSPALAIVQIDIKHVDLVIPGNDAAVGRKQKSAIRDFTAINGNRRRTNVQMNTVACGQFGGSSNNGVGSLILEDVKQLRLVTYEGAPSSLGSGYSQHRPPLLHPQALPYRRCCEPGRFPIASERLRLCKGPVFISSPQAADCSNWSSFPPRSSAWSSSHPPT